MDRNGTVIASTRPSLKLMLQREGTSRLDWDGRDTGGRPVGSGVYLARLRTLGRTESIRMALLR